MHHGKLYKIELKCMMYISMFSPEEAQLLEQENDQLIEQLNQLHNQVDQVSHYLQ